ncbi:MAG: hypothetical protein AAB909_00600 [Patescibacteria group bacterium]
MEPRARDTLRKLIPYIEPDAFIIVGGVAIRYLLSSRHIDYPRRPFNDLDLVTKSLDVVSRKAADEFLVYHHHPVDSFLSLVDPLSKTKIDIFHEEGERNVERVMFDDKTIDISSAEDQLVRTVLDVQSISADMHRDPKWFENMRLLAKIADMKKANEIWKSYRPQNYSENIEEVMEMSERLAKDHPEWLKEKLFRRDKPYKCEQCKNINGFDVVPMEKVYEVLGYVE